MKSLEIKNKVERAAILLDGDYNETNSGVPRIIYKKDAVTASIVYAAKSDRWKVFFPFPASIQKKEYFDNIDQVKEWLQSWE